MQLFILLFTDILFIFHIQLYFLYFRNSNRIYLFRMWDFEFGYISKIEYIIISSIDPPYLSSKQPAHIPRRCFVHYLVIPGVSRRMDTSICHLGVFVQKKLWIVFFLLDTYYYIYLCFLSCFGNK